MRIVKSNQLDKANKMRVGEVAVVEFDDYDKYRSFTVQLSHYNASLGRKRELYIHAASKMKKLQYCLIAVSAEDKEKEESNSNLKGLWKKQIPEEWKRA